MTNPYSVIIAGKQTLKLPSAGFNPGQYTITAKSGHGDIVVEHTVVTWETKFEYKEQPGSPWTISDGQTSSFKQMADRNWMLTPNPKGDNIV